MMKSHRILLLITLLLLAQNITAATLQGRPSRIISGDQLVLTTSKNQRIPIQLLGIQAPPLETRLGRAAKRHLASLAAGRPVTVEYHTRNSLGYPLGKVFLGNLDINMQLLKTGLAIHKPEFQTGPDSDQYLQAMQQAQKRKRGIWAKSQ